MTRAYRGRFDIDTAFLPPQEHTLDSYLQLPKYLAHPKNTQDLLDYATHLQPTKPHELIINSSMLSEAAITATQLSRDQRHALLGLALEELDTALTDAYERQERRIGSPYHAHFLLSPGIIRLEAQRAAHTLFRGMVDGDVSSDVRSRYTHDMTTLAARASEGFVFFNEPSTEYSEKHVDGYLGLAHELNAICSVARIDTPTLAAFPAFARGDTGTHLSHQTHDFHTVELQWGEIQNTILTEVKTTPQPEHYEHYEAILIGGTVHLHPDHSPDPSYLAELLAKEDRRIATSEERATLDAISATVMHSMRHGLASTPQCRDPHTCTLIV